MTLDSAIESLNNQEEFFWVENLSARLAEFKEFCHLANCSRGDDFPLVRSRDHWVGQFVTFIQKSAILAAREKEKHGN